MSMMRLPCEKCETKPCMEYRYCPVMRAHNAHEFNTTVEAVRLMKREGMCHPDTEEE